MTYTPTTDEVDTGFTSYAWKLEQESPGSYGVNSGFESYTEVCAAFRRWHQEELRQAKEQAWREGANTAIADYDLPGLKDIHNPYRSQP